MRATADNWYQTNQRWLLAAIRLARARVAARCGQTPEAPLDELAAAVVQAEAEMPSPSTLRSLATTFELTDFERELLFLCAAAELDGATAALLAISDDRQSLITFATASALLPDAHWSAITPLGTLRRLRLIEVQPGPSLVRCGLRIEERVLHFLTGVPAWDERLSGLLDVVANPETTLAEHEAVAERLSALWSTSTATAMLCGRDPSARRTVAATACRLAGVRLVTARAADLPTGNFEREALCRLWHRESLLTRSALLVELDGDENVSDLPGLIDRLPGLVIVSCRDGAVSRERVLVRVDVDVPETTAQRALWRAALGDDWPLLAPHVDRLAAQFTLSPASVAAAAATLRTQPIEELATRAWDICRQQARARMDALAQRIEPHAGWEDLVLPPSEIETLRLVAAHVRRRLEVFERWGFRGKSDRGTGVSALFFGQSGTGKTTAAEVLARELRLDLYRIDLSQVVSKYIGETEKNLRRVFDAAEQSGAILLFDEADALFGRRSEVKDSHDRYANIEVSYLLQRMEAYRGLAILTSNMKDAIDPAFMRRLRMVVRFPFPDVGQRAQIWERVFPVETPREGLDACKLARLHVPGGTIRNIALHAAFLAAEAGGPVRMQHLLSAARTECAKIDKTVGEHEIAGWV